MENYVTSYAPTETEKNMFLVRTYAWMGFALVLSAVSAFATSLSRTMMYAIWGNKAIGFYILAAVEIALVWGLSLSIRKISPLVAKIMFIAYSIVNGITISSIFWVFSISSIGLCFLGTAALFIGMSIYGAVTKSNLATAGHYLIMALLGLILVSVIEWLVQLITHINLSFIDWLISLATVVIFTGLTAYDSQKIIKAAERADSSADYQKIAIYGALELYLDFINIFLSLLRLFGRKK